MAKDTSIGIRVSTEFLEELEDLRKLYEKKNGLEIKKTAIIESALKEGMKVLRSKLEGEVESKDEKCPNCNSALQPMSGYNNTKYLGCPNFKACGFKGKK